jgi:predicted nucleic acid-binding protein
MYVPGSVGLILCPRPRFTPHHIFYLWRPQLKDPSDDMVLELAVTAGCDYNLTYNVNDFKGSEKFGIEAITPKVFLEMVGEQ